MKHHSSNNVGCIIAVPLIASLFFLYYHFLSNYKQFSSAISDGIWLDVIAILIIVICICGEIVLHIKDKHEREIYNKDRELRIMQDKCEKSINEIKKEIGVRERINMSLVRLLKSKTPFKDVATLKADFETCIYEKDVHYLNYKSNPAHKAATKISIIKNELYKTEK